MIEYYFTGTIERLIFEDANHFFKILLLTIDDTDSSFDDFEIIVTGTIAEVLEGEQYTFWGELSQHPKYGEQLKVTRYEKAKPTATGLIKYFASEHFKGIGLKTAEKIVSIYGENAIDDILENPTRLATISGFSKIARDNFLKKLRVNYGTEQIITQLTTYGLSSKLAFNIFETYKTDSLTILKENPYQLVEDIQGIGFKMADQLAERLGIASDAPQRLRAALVHVLLETSLQEGDTYVDAKHLLERAILLLENSRQTEILPDAVAQQLSQLIAEDKVQHIDTKIFDNSLFYAEAGIKRNLTRLLNTSLGEPISETELLTSLETVEQQLSIRYDSIQRQAIQTAMNSKVFILTGGPGTGKTTVINGIIETYAQLHQIDLTKKELPILLAAPTGRAARRMSELTGLSSATIHRHLGLNGDNDYQLLNDYLDADLIIIDEFSMVDTWLANQLLSAIATNTQVIIVGDSDQLPSVGPGQVLSDLLKIDNIPKVALTKIFRQSDDSTIIHLAQAINSGHLPEDFTTKKADRSYFEAPANHIPNLIQQIIASALKNGIPKEDIQVLAPMYRGQAGITSLNTIIQTMLNPKTDAIDFQYHDTLFRKGDRVLHLVNDAEQNIFNGDIGFITELIPAKYSESKQDEMRLAFEGNDISYPRSEWSKITLAYAMSIHKAQGSEFPVLILPITHQSQRMLQRNLIYTAITRAKSKLIMLGEQAAFAYAAKHQGTSRKTYLVERFNPSSQQSLNNPSTDTLETGDYILTTDNLEQIDPMIGITPEDLDTFFAIAQD